MKKYNYLSYFLILLFGFVIVYQALAQQPMEHTINKEVVDSTRVIILTSGPAEFNSYWLEEPFRLVVEFKSRNVVSKIGNEVVVNQGIIKRITSSYFGRGKKRSIKSLTFELTKKVPYKIHQENDTILLDIQTPLETSAFSIEGGNIFVQDETGDTIIKRLEAMEIALMRGTESKVSSETSNQMIQEVVKGTREEISRAPTNEALVQDNSILQPTEDSKKVEVLPLFEPVSKRKTISGKVFLSAGLAIILGLGSLLWYKSRLNIPKELKKLKSELEEKDKRIEDERIIRKTVEETSLQREKEYQNMKESLIKKGLLKRELLPEEKEKPWITGRSPERRQFSRLVLSRDYSRTIILRIKVPNRPESIKSFANNISSVGLSFETKEEFEDGEPIKLKLFFFGDVVPMMKIQAHIVWRKQVEPINSYGVYFDLVDEKDKIELNRYIESKVAETATEKV